MPLSLAMAACRLPPRAELVIHQYGVFALFALVLLQDLGIPTLVPGTVLVIFGGFLVFSGVTELHTTALSLAAGAFIGATILFFIARYGGRPLFLRLGSYVGLTEKQFDVAAAALERWGPPMMLITRIAPGTRVYMTAFAGISGWTYRRFALWTAIIVLAWSYGFVLLGRALGNQCGLLLGFFRRFSTVLLVLVIILAALYALYLWRANRNRAGPSQPFAATASPSSTSDQQGENYRADSDPGGRRLLRVANGTVPGQARQRRRRR